MGARHSGREAALQMLFQMEASGASAEDTIRLFWKNFEAEAEGKAYADELLALASLRMAVPAACYLYVENADEAMHSNTGRGRIDHASQ